MSIFLTCEAATARLSDYADGALPLWESLMVRLHLLFCPHCRAILATMRLLPTLLAGMDEKAEDAARAALDGALAHIARQGGPRPWPATPIPEEALALLASKPDLPLTILASVHAEVARSRGPEPGPYHLPKGILEQLPPESQWRWAMDAKGRRRAELLQDPVWGQKLILAYAPTGARSQVHRHLGSESILVLSGTLSDQGLALSPGDWVHHSTGSVHAPMIPAEDCWCLIREEGDSVAAGPIDRLKLFRTAG